MTRAVRRERRRWRKALTVYGSSRAWCLTGLRGPGGASRSPCGVSAADRLRWDGRIGSHPSILARSDVPGSNVHGTRRLRAYLSDPRCHAGFGAKPSRPGLGRPGVVKHSWSGPDHPRVGMSIGFDSLGGPTMRANDGVVVWAVSRLERQILVSIGAINQTGTPHVSLPRWTDRPRAFRIQGDTLPEDICTVMAPASRSSFARMHVLRASRAATGCPLSRNDGIGGVVAMPEARPAASDAL